ncbi:PAS/PAC sensor signal transduction histidine kinase [Desulfuromonas soudanensis]|uniref:histidine kinase n=1 Tax=Desulfuromonas soudanensis TaxID=1603606 RepID=A0A0M3QG49_9BACT|nr:MASE3 domain-containing protein [Desulfuromonas soudanensis]ALC17369.1 PAS/PAC sensor signal transduction histidine kinase [Desulfuromonas soudanensis]
MIDYAVSSDKVSTLLLGGAVLIGLCLASFYNYLLFHTLVEFFSVVVACGIFMIAWNTRRIIKNNYFLFVGIASLFVALVEISHVLTYKGLGIFPGISPDIATQLWIASRYLQSLSLLVAPWFIGRRLRAGWTIAFFLTLTSLLLTAVFSGNFPACFVEGSGLTPFKKGSEYLVCLLFLGAIYFMVRKKEAFNRGVVRLLSGALLCFIAAELAFTLYSDVYGLSNAIGHILKFAGFYLVYKALIETVLARPYDLLFRELKQSEERYRRLYKDTPVMLHSIDRDGRLVSVSNYWLAYLGYGKDEAINVKLTSFFTEESRRYAEEVVFPEYFQTGYCKDVPYRIRKKNGEILDVLLSATADRDDQGEIIRSLAVMIDITERKRASEKIASLNASLAAKAEELEKANLELESFSHTVAHDLRAPLTNISGACQGLNELCADTLDGKSKKFIDYIHDETLRMDLFISALLDFSHLNRQELHREELDLSEMAAAIVLGLRMREPERQVTFTLAEGVKCLGDPVLIYSVLENLLGNAWKYTGARDEARIEFGVIAEEEKPVFFVRDNGAGFDMNQAHRLFGAFQRLHNRDEFAGTGLGLTTVQRILFRHGGRIWAEGEKDKGATFFFTL